MRPFDDMEWRYTPRSIMTLNHGVRPVIRTISHPPKNHPDKCPIGNDYTALELITDTGDRRFFGVADAKINSELRFIIRGTYSGDEVRMKWPICTNM
jgi:hypothetical protein